MVLDFIVSFSVFVILFIIHFGCHYYFSLSLKRRGCCCCYRHNRHPLIQLLFFSFASHSSCFFHSFVMFYSLLYYSAPLFLLSLVFRSFYISLFFPMLFLFLFLYFVFPCFVYFKMVSFIFLCKIGRYGNESLRSREPCFLNVCLLPSG